MWPRLYGVIYLMSAIIAARAESEYELSEEKIIKPIPACTSEKTFMEYNALTSKATKSAAEFLSSKAKSGECVTLEPDEPVQAKIGVLVDFHLSVIRKKDNQEYFTYANAISEHWTERTVLRSVLACQGRADFLAYENALNGNRVLANRFAAEKLSLGDCITLKQGEIIKLEGDGGWGYQGRASLGVISRFSRAGGRQYFHTYTDALVAGMKRHQDVPWYEDSIQSVKILMASFACKDSKDGIDSLHTYHALSGREQKDFVAAKVHAGECIEMKKGELVRTESSPRSGRASIIRKGDVQWYIVSPSALWTRTPEVRGRIIRLRPKARAQDSGSR
jgi:hypothetical protein